MHVFRYEETPTRVDGHVTLESQMSGMAHPM